MILDSGFRFVYFPYMNNIRLFIERQIFVVKVWSERVKPLSFQSSVRRIYDLCQKRPFGLRFIFLISNLCFCYAM